MKAGFTLFSANIKANDIQFKHVIDFYQDKEPFKSKLSTPR
jgi:hypothetical protein